MGPRRPLVERAALWHQKKRVRVGLAMGTEKWPSPIASYEVTDEQCESGRFVSGR